MSRWNNYKVRSKILITVLPLFIIFSSTLIFVWNKNLSEEAINTAVHNASSQMNISNEVFELSIKEIYNVMVLLALENTNNTSVRDLLEADPSNYKEYLSNQRSADKYISGLCSFRPYLKGLSIFDGESSYIEYGAPLSFSEIQEMEWYNDIKKLKPKELYFTPLYSNRTFNEESKKDTFSMVYPISEGDTILGYVMADVSIKILEDIFLEPSNNDGELYVVDMQSKEIIYSKKSGSDAGILNYKLFELENNMHTEVGFFLGTSQKVEYLFIFYKSKFTPWTIITIIPKVSIIKPFITAKNNVLLLSILFIIINVITLFTFSKKITKDITLFSNAVAQIDKDNLELEVTINSKDEIGQLYFQFSCMIDRIKKLMKEIKQSEIEKRKAEMRTLLAQINPHFLYNTLNTIKFLAVMQGADNIKEVSESLSTLMHINMDMRSFIKLREEVEYLESYLAIQGYHYKNKFTYNIFIDEGLENIMIPKLLVQPIVENSLKHGVRPQKHLCIIRILFVKDNDKLIIRIKDSGVGMSKEIIDSVMNMANSEAIGLKNIIHRIRLLFGEEYGIRITSEVGLFTEFELTIPIISEHRVSHYV